MDRSGATEQVAKYLLEEIQQGRIKAGDKLPPRGMLARKFKISPTSVSAAISSVSKTKRVKFVPGKGLYLSASDRPARRTFTVGLIGWLASHPSTVGARVDNYWSGILSSLTFHASKRGWALSFIPRTDREPLDVEWILEHHPDALISHGICLREETVLELRRRGVPLILLGGRRLEHLDVSSVQFDATGGFRKAAEIFTDHGHRKVACLLKAPTSPEGHQAWQDAFCTQMALRGCLYDYSKYWRVWGRKWSPVNIPVLMEFVRAQVTDLLDMPEPPTAFYCFLSSDMAVRVVQDVATARSLTVGKDISILAEAFHEDESPFSVLLSSCGKLAEALIDTLSGLTENPHRVYHIDIPKRFVDHGSIARLEVPREALVTVP